MVDLLIGGVEVFPDGSEKLNYAYIFIHNAALIA